MRESPRPRLFSKVADRRSFLRCGVGAGLAGVAWGLAKGPGSRVVAAAAAPELAFARSGDALQLNLGPRMVMRYQLIRPSLGGPQVESGCYFHPVTTPAGLVVTQVAPDDHRHHRGIFFGWVEMHGAMDADFWGWGEHAPTKGRRIVNESLETPQPALGYARFRALNAWMVEDRKLVSEDLRVGTALREGATVMDFTVQHSVTAELKLTRWAFGGFAVRLRNDGGAVPIGPAGEVKLDPPKHTEPASNWPPATWYGLHLKLPDGKQATVVVVGRAKNPESTWHVVPGIGLINPCITAPAGVTLTPDHPLLLRYRVMAFDGPPRLDVINRLADGWYRGVLD